MTKPTSYLIRMILFCLIVYGGVAAISPSSPASTWPTR